MKEKLKLITDKGEFYAELSVATKRTIGTIKTHWFGKSGSVPIEFQKVVEATINKRLEYQKASKQLHEKYFGN